MATLSSRPNNESDTISGVKTDGPDHSMERAAPCPQCGYDLRGHPDVARCPECGTEVHLTAARWQAVRWLDLRLLDLWSIGMLQGIGCLSFLAAIFAIRRGEYFALLLALLSGLCVLAATLWFAVTIVLYFSADGRAVLRLIGTARARRLARWLVLDAALIGAPVLLLILVTQL